MAMASCICIAIVKSSKSKAGEGRVYAEREIEEIAKFIVNDHSLERSKSIKELNEDSEGVSRGNLSGPRVEILIPPRFRLAIAMCPDPFS